jgi:hypothetical protein
MSEIQIYVKTSALGEDGIHWRNVSKPYQPREIPPILDPEVKESYIVPSKVHPTGYSTVEPLVLAGKPSILFAVNAGKLFLEITGIEAVPERSNQLGRNIFDVIAWLADENKDNIKIFKNLAAKALQGFCSDDKDFIDIVRNSIKFEGKDKFIVDRNSLANLITSDSPQNKNFSGKQDQDSVWIQSSKNISEKQIHSLIDHILLDPLPINTSPFVFVIKKDVERILYSRINLLSESYSPISTVRENKDKLDDSNTILSNNQTENGLGAIAEKKSQKMSPLIVFSLGLLVGTIIGLMIAVTFMQAKIPHTIHLPQTSSIIPLRY